MIFSVCLFFLIIFSLIGIVDLVVTLVNLSHLPSSNQEEKVFILPLEGHLENLEYIIRSIVLYSSPKCKISIICVDLGLDFETKKICSLLSQDFSCLKIINSKSEIPH